MHFDLSKKHKRLIWITSFVVLIPMVAGLFLWPLLPAELVTHFDANNQPSGWIRREFIVFGLPLVCLLIHLLCCFSKDLNPKKNEINAKMYKLVLWMAPMVSIGAGVSLYGFAFGYRLDVSIMTSFFVGVLTCMLVLLIVYLLVCHLRHRD